jgi:hypothetical protein
MKQVKFSIIAILVLIMSSCAEKIDTTTDETMKESVKKVKESLEGEKKEKFENSLKLLMFSGMDFKQILSDGDPDKTVNDMKSLIDGKTADEIIAEGEKIQKEIDRKKKEQAKGEIDELYEAKEKANSDRSMLAKFEVKRSRFYIRTSGTYYVTKQPVIEMTVMNGTGQAISRGYFKGTLSSPNRSIPWLKDDFNYEISGGLEPGEEVTWYLEPNMFSDWGKVDAPKDAILTISVNQLDGANKETLYSINNFGESEQERLDKLLASYPDLKK